MKILLLEVNDEKYYLEQGSSNDFKVWLYLNDIKIIGYSFEWLMSIDTYVWGRNWNKATFIPNRYINLL